MNGRCATSWPGVRILADTCRTSLPETSERISGSPPAAQKRKKQHLAGLRRFFNLLVERHICIINPAAVAETEKLTVVEGKTPEITRKHTRRLLESIDCTHVVALRDRAIIGILMYTAARAGAVSKLELEHYYDAGEQWMLRFRDKGGKSREIPVSHDLKTYLDEYLEYSGLRHGRRRRHPDTGKFRPRPLFRTAMKKKRELTGTPMSGRDITRMLKRRFEDAGLPLLFLHTLFASLCSPTSSTRDFPSRTCRNSPGTPTPGPQNSTTGRTGRAPETSWNGFA